jgi:carbon monoxide dehydrogenase subunit G
VIHIEVDLDIGRPPKEVFEYLEEVENNTEWLSGMRSSRWTSPPPVGAGSTYEQVSQFLGREIHTSFEVTRHQAGRLVTIESREGSSFPIKVTRMVRPNGDGGSHVTEIVDGDARGFYSVASPLLKRMVERTIRRDYGKLKQLLESR